MLQTAGEAFGKVVGWDTIGLRFSEEDTSGMRSSSSASAGTCASLSAIETWRTDDGTRSERGSHDGVGLGAALRARIEPANSAGFETHSTSWRVDET